MLLLTAQCKRTEVQGIIGKHQRLYLNGHDYKTSYQAMTIGNHTITLNATAPNLYEVIAEVSRALEGKTRNSTLKTAPMPPLTEATTRSHNEIVIDQHGIHFNNDVMEFITICHDNLAGKEWLEANHDKEYESPTIEITIEDKAFKTNGDFKPGMIKDFMSKHTKRVRAGRKMMTVMPDEVVVNMGGGVYINTTPDKIG